MKKLKVYIKDWIKKQQYKRSFKKTSKDNHLWHIAEEGLDDYCQQLKAYD